MTHWGLEVLFPLSYWGSSAGWVPQHSFAWHEMKYLGKYIVSWSFYFGMYLQEEAEVPDDEQLNDMIARNEDEMELFTVSFKHHLVYDVGLHYHIVTCTCTVHVGIVLFPHALHTCYIMVDICQPCPHSTFFFPPTLPPTLPPSLFSLADGHGKVQSRCSGP